MIELRFHSRGGQGGVVAGKILAVAVFKEGRHVQAFPTFGVERRAAPVKAFVRIDDQPIRLRNQIYEPDHVVVLDPSLIAMEDVTQGLKPGGTILINSDKPPDHFGFANGYRVVTVDASTIAVRNGLGSVTQPIVNTAILGAVSKALGVVDIESVVSAIGEEVPGKAAANAKAAREAYAATGGQESP
ncbi:MAG: pyruvate ferredoxin oxidoreductase [Calditrichaeota bacterium]|nr:pyruvate ferredoxin oxidoreductase [Calditrichota bacterium]